jgi:hypothetical protein
MLLFLTSHHYQYNCCCYNNYAKQLDTLPVSVTDKQAMRDTIAKYQSKIVQHKKGLIKAAAASALATGTKAAEVHYATLYFTHYITLSLSAALINTASKLCSVHVHCARRLQSCSQCCAKCSEALLTTAIIGPHCSHCTCMFTSRSWPH